MITFTGSFHGRTMAGISATGQEKVKTGFAPLLESFTHIPFGDLEAVRAALRPDTCAILLEPVQGEGGIHPASASFLRGLRALADGHRCLLLYDEVQCGLGRTGDWCGWRSIAPDGAEPDAVSWAKGIANGFPLGSFWISSRPLADSSHALCDLFGPGSHSTTYGGNPVCCAAARAVLRVIERDNLLENTRSTGEKLRTDLETLASPDIAAVRSIGLMIGIELSHHFTQKHPPSGEVPLLPSLVFSRMAMDAGLLVIPAGERVVRLLPPLNITPEEAALALDVLKGLLEPAPEKASG